MGVGSRKTLAGKRESRRVGIRQPRRRPGLVGTKVGGSPSPMGSSARHEPAWPGRGEARASESRGMMGDLESSIVPAHHLPGAWEGESSGKADTQGGCSHRRKGLMSPLSMKKR